MNLKTKKMIFLSLLLSVPFIIIIYYNMFVASTDKNFVSVLLMLLLSLFEVVLNFLTVGAIINIFTVFGVKNQVNETPDYTNKKLGRIIILLLTVYIISDFLKLFTAISDPAYSIIFSMSCMSVLSALYMVINKKGKSQ